MCSQTVFYVFFSESHTIALKDLTILLRTFSAPDSGPSFSTRIWRIRRCQVQCWRYRWLSNTSWTLPPQSWSVPPSSSLPSPWTASSKARIWKTKLQSCNNEQHAFLFQFIAEIKVPNVFLQLQLCNNTDARTCRLILQPFYRK